MIFNNKIITDNYIISLSAIFQCAYYVNILAQEDIKDDVRINKLINTSLVNDANSYQELYGDRTNLFNGASTIVKILRGDTTNELINIQKYVISLSILEKNIQREVNKYKSFQNELDSTNYKKLDTGVENHISYLSNLYVKYFSPLKPRVIVIGKSVYLEKNALFIRSLLLAGIRASMLWRLSGGSKWHFLMYRKKILQKINDYLKI